MSEKEIVIKAEGKKSEKKEETGDKKWNEIVSDYKTPEELATAYKALKSKEKVVLSSKEEEFNSQVKSFFGETATEDSKLENTDLKALSLELRDKTGVTPRILDLAVSKTAAKLLNQERSNTKVAANAFMNDKLNQQAVEAALEEQDASYVTDFKSRFASGQVSKAELNLLKSMKKEVVEADNSFKTDEINNRSLQNEEDELLHILQDQANIWCDPGHPEYKKVNDRKLQLKQLLKV